MKKRRTRSSVYSQRRSRLWSAVFSMMRSRTCFLWSFSIGLGLLLALSLDQFVRQYPLKQIKIISTFQQVSESELVEVITRSLKAKQQHTNSSTLTELASETDFDQKQPIPLMSVDMRAISDELSHFTWVDNVKIARRWPHTLEVTVNEQIPAAVFNNKYWVNSRGELFSPLLSKATTKNLDRTETPKKEFALLKIVKAPVEPRVRINAELAQRLPNLFGPLDKAEYVIRIYQQFANLLRAATITPYFDSKHSSDQADNRLLLLSLHMTDQFGWMLGLQSSAAAGKNPVSFTVSLDQAQPVKKLKRFIFFYDQLAEKRSNLKSVDVRYAHGLAVEWSLSNVYSVSVAAATLD